MFKLDNAPPPICSRQDSANPEGSGGAAAPALGDLPAETRRRLSQLMARVIVRHGVLHAKEARDD